MSELVRLTKDGDIGVITIDNPPVNALGPGVPEGIINAVTECSRDSAIKGIVLTGAGKIFCGGADINEFGKLTSGKKPLEAILDPLLYALEDSAKPVVCAIHGTAFGGGMETAMACHYRVAVAGAQLGQPEVKIGLIPGAGGTQRLPRLAGVPKALEMCAGGDPISAADALASGIVDKIIEGELAAGRCRLRARDRREGRPAAKDPRPQRQARDGRRQRADLRRRPREGEEEGARIDRPPQGS